MLPVCRFLCETHFSELEFGAEPDFQTHKIWRENRFMERDKLESMRQRNRRLIDAVIEKAGRVCPGSLAMIGVYGSFCTGDVTAHSDLDLLILTRDERGRALSSGFLIDGIGFDFYCTTWESLEAEAAYTSPHIAKLMDSEIVFCPEEADRTRLEALRQRVREICGASFAADALTRAEQPLFSAERAFARLLCAENIRDSRAAACEMLYELESAVCLLNKSYFRCGVKRVFEELGRLPETPENFEPLARRLAAAATPEEMRETAHCLMRAVYGCFDRVRGRMAARRETPTPEDLHGTLEEVVSNWRGKLIEAAVHGDAHAALMALGSAQIFFDEAAGAFDMPRYDAVSCFDLADLRGTAERFDAILRQYAAQYARVGLVVSTFPDTDAFLDDYLRVPAKAFGTA